MRLTRCIPTLLIAAMCGAPRADDSFASSTYASSAAEYLRLPLHAYAAGLSGAVTAWRTGTAGSQFNPAIYEATTTLQVTASNTFWPDDRTLYGGQASASVGDFFVLAASFAHAGVDGIERRNEWGTLENYFSDAENAVTVAVAGRLQWNLAWGLAGRYLSQRLADENANGMGFDAGATWEPDSHLCVGVSALNIGSRLFWSTDQVDKVLMQARLGVSGTLLGDRLTIAADIVKPLQQPIDVAAAIQFQPLDLISVRGGVMTSIDYRARDVRRPEFSLGAGMRHSFFGFDYAITIPLEKIGVMHRISIVFITATPLF
jgi:hypothetical protein